VPDLVLLHFEPRYEHAGHYLLFEKSIGAGGDYARRVVAGKVTAPHALVEAAMLAGCELSIARIFHGATRADRRRLRAHNGLSRHCPICHELGVARA
jgi:hypothetical protein